MLADDPVGLGDRAVAALLRGEIDDHAAGLHGRDHFLGDQFRRRPSRNQCRRDDDVHIPGLLGEQRHFGLDEFFAHDLGVTAFAGPLFLEFQHQEFAVHALDLLLHLRPCIEGAHDRAHASGNADGGESGHAGPDHQHLGRRHASGGGDLPGEKPTEMLRRFDHCAVAGDIGHGAQRIELLGTGYTGDAVHGERGDTRLCQPLEKLWILGGPEERDQRLSRMEQIEFAIARCPHLENDVAPGQEFGRGFDHIHPGIEIGRIVEAGGDSGPRLDRDREPELLKLLRHVRRDGNAPLARVCFAGNADSHANPPAGAARSRHPLTNL